MGPIAIVDTNIVILLATKPNEEESAVTGVRRERVRVCMEWLRESKARFWIPAVVVTELYKTAPGGELVREVFAPLRKTRNVPFGTAAADAAGEILMSALRARDPSKSKTVMKFDALIAATAR